MHEPSEPAPLLDNLLTRLLNRIELTSKVRSGMSSDGPGYVSRGKPEHRDPRGEAELFNRKIREDYNFCETNAERLLVIKRAQSYLNSIVLSPDRSLVRGTVEWKLAIATRAGASAAVGRIYGVSASRVRQLRRELAIGKLSASGTGEPREHTV